LTDYKQWRRELETRANSIAEPGPTAVENQTIFDGMVKVLEPRVEEILKGFDPKKVKPYLFRAWMQVMETSFLGADAPQFLPIEPIESKRSGTDETAFWQRQREEDEERGIL
jgi:hypothetical protein